MRNVLHASTTTKILFIRIPFKNLFSHKEHQDKIGFTC